MTSAEVAVGTDPLRQAALAVTDLGRQLGPSTAAGSLQAVAEVAAARVLAQSGPASRPTTAQPG